MPNLNAKNNIATLIHLIVLQMFAEKNVKHTSLSCVNLCICAYPNTVLFGVTYTRPVQTIKKQNRRCANTGFSKSEVLLKSYTVELQWLEHLWDHENMFEAGVVRDNEG